MAGHSKAVSYVKFLSAREMASASTDNTLKLWDVQDCQLIHTMRGHANERNFVGLSATKEYITCGSETNDLYLYHKAMTMPMMWHQFNSPDSEEHGKQYVLPIGD